MLIFPSRFLLTFTFRPGKQTSAFRPRSDCGAFELPKGRGNLERHASAAEMRGTRTGHQFSGDAVHGLHRLHVLPGDMDWNRLMVHRNRLNRWFTELKMGGLSIAMLVYRRVCQWEFQDPIYWRYRFHIFWAYIYIYQAYVKEDPHNSYGPKYGTFT